MCSLMFSNLLHALESYFNHLENAANLVLFGFQMHMLSLIELS